MQFADYSPPENPTREQQADALQKGLGRAMQWALAGKLDDDLLLDACLRDKRFDRGFEDSRGAWLWRMMVAGGARPRFRDAILDAFRNVADEGDAQQFCHFALEYGREGDSDFREALRHFVFQRKDGDAAWFGERCLVALDGKDAFRDLVRTHGQSLAIRDYQWFDYALVDAAIQDIGETSVEQVLHQVDDESIRRFVERRREYVEKKPPSRRNRDELLAVPPARVIELARMQKPNFSFRGWGAAASEGALNEILAAIWTTSEPTALANLLKVLSNRALPRFDARLFDLCLAGDDRVKQIAFRALAKNKNPLVREFALRQLAAGASEAAVQLFRLNFQSGDEELISLELQVPADDWRRHGMLSDLIHVLEENRDADCSKLGVMIWWATPCSACRYYATRLLHAGDAAPAWLIQECQHDAEKDSWTLVSTNYDA